MVKGATAVGPDLPLDPADLLGKVGFASPVAFEVLAAFVEKPANEEFPKPLFRLDVIDALPLKTPSFSFQRLLLLVGFCCSGLPIV